MSNKKKRDWMLLIAYCILIFYLSSQSELRFVKATEEKAGFKVNSFYKHILEYTLLGFLMQRTLETPHASTLFATYYGVTDEIHQWFTPLRVFSNYDILANAIGSLLGVIFALVLKEVNG